MYETYDVAGTIKLMGDLHPQTENIVIVFFQPEAEQKGIKFTLKNSLSQEECRITTDKIKLVQIVVSLVSNALKFTNQGEVVFGYELNGIELHFWVQDTGPGIPDRLKVLIFERKKAVENNSLKQKEGMGLGLSISKTLVELMNGKIWMISKVDQGSVFNFVIPYQSAGDESIS